MTAAPRIDTPLGPVTFVVWSDVDLNPVIGPAQAEVPGGFQPVTLWTATWRFAAHQAMSGFQVVAGLTAGPDVDGGPESGERLDAVTFANASGTVSIGGPDEEYLLDVLGVQCDVRYLGDRTVSWRLPGFTPTGTAELTIAVAWSGPGDTLATWFAVGRH
ncbi:hypothetical protein ACWGE0_19590 [Lentzea sp. NPDC054927]